MADFVPCERDQAFLLPPSMRDWLPQDDLAHVVIAAAECVSMAAFQVNDRNSGKPQDHPRMMLALLVHAYANGLFASRRIERATHRDLGVRFVAANTHPDHDTIAAFRRQNRAAFEAAFVDILLMARHMRLLRVGAVSVDGTKINAHASKVRSVRYDRAQVLRTKLAADIAALTAQADAADAADLPDPQALPAEIARRQTLKAKLDAACAQMQAEAAQAAGQARPAFEAKQAAWQAKKGRRGRPPVPPDPAPPPKRQANLTDPSEIAKRFARDSALMRRLDHHEYRQAHNAQAVVDADGSQLVLAAHVTRCSSDAPSFSSIILAMAAAAGLPGRVLADAGFASGPGGGRLAGAWHRAAGRDLAHPAAPALRLPPAARPEAGARRARPVAGGDEGEDGDGRCQGPLDAKAHDKKRKQTVEPVFGIIKAAMGFRQFSLRGLGKAATEGSLVTLACNCRPTAGAWQRCSPHEKWRASRRCRTLLSQQQR